MAEYFIPADLCDDLLCCVICYEPFAEDRIPKALPCLHTFCHGCLESTITSHTRKQYSRKIKTPGYFPCPICNERCKIPENGSDGFKDDFRIRRMSEALNITKSRSEGQKNEQEQEEAEKEKEKDIEEESSTSSRKCDVCKFFNKQSEASLFCLECSKHLCDSCSAKHLRTPIASDHSMVKESEAIQSETTCSKHLSEVLKYYCRTCAQLVCMTCTLSEEHTDHDVTTVEKQSKKVKEGLEKMVQDCQERIPQIAADKVVLENIGKRVEDKEKLASKAILARTFEEMSRIKNNQAKMERDLSKFCKNKYKDLDNRKKAIDRVIAEIAELSSFANSVMDRGQDIQVVGSYVRVMARFNEVVSTASSSNTPDGSTFANLGKYEALVEDELETTQTSSDQNQASILADIKSVVSQMRRFSQGRFDLRVDPIKVIGRKGSADGEFNFPAGVTVLNNGDIAVADMHNYRVQIFDMNGNFKNKFGQEGFKPCGIATTNDGEIAVTDCKSGINCIKVFTPAGEKVKQLGMGVFDYPFSLAVDSLGHFIVSDPAVSKIYILDSDGQVVSSFSTKSKFTFYVTVDSRDEILVSDWYHHHIKVFNTSGRLLRKIGSRGQEDGQLLVPLGIVCDKKDNVIVLDCKCERVSMFSNDGTFLNHLIGRTEEIKHSRAMALSSDGYLVITHGDNKRDLPNEVRLYKM